jgi:molybdopterin molybdotransferase
VGQGRNDIADAIADWLAYAIAADGGEPVTTRPGGEVEALLTSGGVDAVAMIGGTGAGGHDDTVHALARTGSVEAHGIALLPGETAVQGGELDRRTYRAVWLVRSRLRALCEPHPN